MEPADPYQAPRTSEWVEEPTLSDDGRSARWVAGLGILYLLAVGVAAVGVLATLINRSGGPPLISGAPRWTLASCGLAVAVVVGWSLSVATYRMQVAQGRPLYAAIVGLLGFLSGGMLLAPLLGFGPTSPRRSSPETEEVKR